MSAKTQLEFVPTAIVAILHDASVSMSGALSFRLPLLTIYIRHQPIRRPLCVSNTCILEGGTVKVIAVPGSGRT